MSEENRPSEDVQPLARPVNEEQLARPTGGEPEETPHQEPEQEEARPETGQEEASPAEEGRREEEDKSMVEKIKDKLTGE